MVAPNAQHKYKIEHRGPFTATNQNGKDSRGRRFRLSVDPEIAVELCTSVGGDPANLVATPQVHVVLGVGTFRVLSVYNNSIDLDSSLRKQVQYWQDEGVAGKDQWLFNIETVVPTSAWPPIHLKTCTAGDKQHKVYAYTTVAGSHRLQATFPLDTQWQSGTLPHAAFVIPLPVLSAILYNGLRHG